MQYLWGLCDLYCTCMIYRPSSSTGCMFWVHIRWKQGPLRCEVYPWVRSAATTGLSPSIGHADFIGQFRQNHFLTFFMEITSKAANKQQQQKSHSTSLSAAVSHVPTRTVDVAVTAGACQILAAPEIHLRFKQQEWKTCWGGAAFSLSPAPQTRRHGQSAQHDSNDELVRARGSCNTCFGAVLHTAASCGRSQRILWDVHAAVMAVMQHHYALHDNVNMLDMK